MGLKEDTMVIHKYLTAVEGDRTVKMPIQPFFLLASENL
jgi:hypothetical protein